LVRRQITDNDYLSPDRPGSAGWGVRRTTMTTKTFQVNSPVVYASETAWARYCEGDLPSGVTSVHTDDTEETWEVTADTEEEAAERCERVASGLGLDIVGRP